jgi:hypothetical protein
MRYIRRQLEGQVLRAAKAFSAVVLVEYKAGRTVTPAMAAPMQRLAAALKRSRAKVAGTKMLLVHQSPQAGTPTPAVAPGVRALPWQEFLEML